MIRSALQRKWIRRLAWLLAFTAVFLVVRAWQTRDLITGPAPAFELLSLDGTILSPARFAGQPHVIYFWATWCPVCKVQRGAIESVAKDYPVIAVALGEDAATVRDYLAGAPTPLLMASDSDGRVARRYGVRGVPAMFFIDAEGNIVAREMGYTSAWGVRARLWLASD